MLRLCGFIAAFIFASLTTFDACADRRVAFVIGNSDYLQFPALKNPVKDAEDVSKTFRLAGFEGCKSPRGRLCIRMFAFSLLFTEGVSVYFPLCGRPLEMLAKRGQLFYAFAGTA